MNLRSYLDAAREHLGQVVERTMKVFRYHRSVDSIRDVEDLSTTDSYTISRRSGKRFPYLNLNNLILGLFLVNLGLFLYNVSRDNRYHDEEYFHPQQTIVQPATTESGSDKSTTSTKGPVEYPRGFIVPGSQRIILPGDREYTELTGIPERIWIPSRVKFRPNFESAEYSWWPRENFYETLDNFSKNSFQFGVSATQAEKMFSNLEGAIVADIGAGTGNNIEYWMSKIGDGKLIETDIDPNACSFMAYVAHELGKRDLRYTNNTVVIQSLYDNPCLPLGRVKLVLASQLHENITTGVPYKRTPENIRIFEENRARFLSFIKNSLTPDGLFVVIEGHQRRNIKDFPKDIIYLDMDEAIDGIEKSSFVLVECEDKPNLWIASFRKK